MKRFLPTMAAVIPKHGAVPLIILLAVISITAQSTNQDFPTPVTANEITGKIPARDLGDPRLTTHYYSVESAVGDLFVNVQTHNFSGDIDIFTLSGLQPLGKIVIYADLGDTETGRVVYLRKPEKLLLRIQGRTPGDEAAAYRIKFAGSFVASDPSEAEKAPELPKVTIENEGPVRVNAVGTIIERPPTRREKAEAAQKARVAERENDSEKAKETDLRPSPNPSKATGRVDEVAPKREEPKVVVTDESAIAAVPAKAEPPSEERPKRTAPSRNARKREPIVKNLEETAQKPSSAEKPTRNRAKPAVSREAPKLDPLAGITLVISLKDGTRIERTMAEVLRFSVDKGVLTVIAKDGSITRYSILDVAKVTIE